MGAKVLAIPLEDLNNISTRGRDTSFFRRQRATERLLWVTDATDATIHSFRNLRAIMFHEGDTILPGGISSAQRSVRRNQLRYFSSIPPTCDPRRPSVYPSPNNPIVSFYTATAPPIALFSYSRLPTARLRPAEAVSHSSLDLPPGL